MDIVTLLGGGYFMEKCGGKELLLRVLGPAADVAGERLAASAKRIFERADKKISFHNIPTENRVSDSIVHQLAYDWIYNEEEIFAEYYGGVLASSKQGQNDLGKSIGHTINRLSAYALRFHFIIYNVMRNTFLGKNINIDDDRYCSLCHIFIKKTDMDRAMIFSKNDEKYISEIYSSCLTSLAREGLLYGQYSYGQNLDINSVFTMPEPGFVVGPSSPGASLLLWAAGYGLQPGKNIFSPDIELSPKNLLLLEQIAIPEAKKVPRGGQPIGKGARALALMQQMEEYIMRD